MYGSLTKELESCRSETSQIKIRFLFTYNFISRLFMLALKVSNFCSFLFPYKYTLLSLTIKPLATRLKDQFDPYFPLSSNHLVVLCDLRLSFSFNLGIHVYTHPYTNSLHSITQVHSTAFGTCCTVLTERVSLKFCPKLSVDFYRKKKSL